MALGVSGETPDHGGTVQEPMLLAEGDRRREPKRGAGRVIDRDLNVSPLRRSDSHLRTPPTPRHSEYRPI
jgi:hypothetical protein